MRILNVLSLSLSLSLSKCLVNPVKVDIRPAGESLSLFVQKPSTMDDDDRMVSYGFMLNIVVRVPAKRK